MTALDVRGLVDVERGLIDRRIFADPEIYRQELEQEIVVDCNFIVHRSRLAVEEDLWVGRREDTLRKVGGEWKIARRDIFLDQAVLKSKNLSSFF